MKVLSLLGSPRANGNTALVLRYLEQKLEEKGLEINRIHVGGLSIQGCKECFGCKRDDESLCCFDDDAIHVLRDILAADVILWASPTFCWGFPAQLKALMDRMYCLLKWKEGEEGYRSMLEGKLMALLVTAGGEEKDNADILGKAYQQMVSFMKCRSVGIVYIAPWCDESPLNREVCTKLDEFVDSFVSAKIK
ncbi:MAG: flavodoxin family protein [Candidatus Hydrogenedentes bacterium]|nr:flavodoxin family protein [Candidatus Hydrogenedentota bacterium]